MGLDFRSGNLFNKFSLEETLGKGSIGQVWKAKDTIIGRTAALKILDPEAEKNAKKKGKNLKIREIFIQEAKNLGRLQPKTIEDHKPAERIAQVYEANIDQKTGLMYIAQEFVEGVTLATTLREKRKIDARKIIEQILEGLQYAHERGVIHRDLSIHNVMISQSGARIIDFGIGSLGIPTSILYLAPELIQNPENSSPQTDLWSTGIIAYRITHGRFPFGLKNRNIEEHDNARTTLDDVVKTKEEYEDVRRQILEEELENVPMIKIARTPLERTIRKLLEKKPEYRPKNAYKALRMVARPEEITTLARAIPIYGGIVSGILYFMLCLGEPKNYLLAIEAGNKKEIMAYSNPESMGALHSEETPKSLPRIVSKDLRAADYDKKYALIEEPEIMIQSTEGRYVLYGNVNTLYLLDTKTGESNNINIQPANEESILFERILRIVDNQGRYFAMNPKSPNIAIPKNIKQVINGTISPEEIRQIATDGRNIFYATRTHIYDEESDTPLVEGVDITNLNYVQYKSEATLFYIDEGTQCGIPLRAYYGYREQNNEMPTLDKKALTAAPMERVGMKILERVGEEWFLITVNEQKHLWNSRIDKTYAPPFLESATTITSTGEKFFYTAKVRDETGDGIIDEKDSRTFICDAGTGKLLEGPRAIRIAIVKTDYEE
ncbi:serine/threonine protein kinase [Candidatus Woesearchaeota archaeon]|nr:serine/threonine protein kinase [Candidatus Woesearchaeota archaeon]